MKFCWSLQNQVFLVLRWAGKTVAKYCSGKLRGSFQVALHWVGWLMTGTYAISWCSERSFWNLFSRSVLRSGQTSQWGLEWSQFNSLRAHSCQTVQSREFVAFLNSLNRGTEAAKSSLCVFCEVCRSLMHNVGYGNCSFTCRWTPLSCWCTEIWKLHGLRLHIL